MPHANEIGKRPIRILLASIIGAVLGMWIFGILGIFAIAVWLWANQSWSMAAIFITVIGIFQCVQGTICGAAVGLLAGAIKRPVPAVLAAGLGGTIIYYALFGTANSTTPWITVLGMFGIASTAIALPKILDFIRPPEPRKPTPRLARNIGIGCFAIFALPLTIYLLHGLLVVSESYIAQLAWQQKGITDYSIKSSYVAFGSSIGKGETLVVRNGQIVDIQGGAPPYIALDRYRMITVDGMYDYIRSIAFVPNYWVMVAYDSDYSYPEEIRTNCKTLGECEYVLHVEEFQIGGATQ